jgi:hypothetical protein
MEPEGSLPCLQESATGPYPLHILPPYFPKIHVNIIPDNLAYYVWSKTVYVFVTLQFRL